MITQINGKDAPWTPVIQQKWDCCMQDVTDPRLVWQANYFTPRPYVDEYNRGSNDEGFTYVRGREVYQVLLPTGSGQ